MGRFLFALEVLVMFCAAAAAQNLNGTTGMNATCKPYAYSTAASNNSTNVKNAAGAVCSFISITNIGSTTGGNVRFYDSTSAPTCSSATGVVLGPFPIPVNATAANVAGFTIAIPVDIQFVNGVSFCITGAVATNDNTNFVTGAQLNFGYH